MADNSISGAYRILPTYPVKPSQPTDKDREQEQRQRKPDEPPDTDNENSAESDRDDDKPVIDEYV